MQAAKEYGCQTIGAGINREEAAKPVFLEEAGGIGIFAVTFNMKSMETPDDEPGVFFWKDTERIQKTIDEIKDKCRWCVMVVHGQSCEFTDPGDLVPNYLRLSQAERERLEKQAK